MSGLGLIVFCGLLIAAAGADVARYRIPNLLPAALAAAGLIFALPHDLMGGLSQGTSLLILGLTALGLYLAGALGGGDVKLLAAAGLWMPLATLPLFLVGLALAGGLQAGGVLAMRAVAPPAPTRPARMPYALSIAAAGCFWAAVQGFAR